MNLSFRCLVFYRSNHQIFVDVNVSSSIATSADIARVASFRFKMFLLDLDGREEP